MRRLWSIGFALAFSVLMLAPAASARTADYPDPVAAVMAHDFEPAVVVDEQALVREERQDLDEQRIAAQPDDMTFAKVNRTALSAGADWGGGEPQRRPAIVRLIAAD